MTWLQTPSIADPDFWRGKRVVVTGGSGFIGSFVVERLAPLCASLVVPTRQVGIPRHLSTIAPQIELKSGDLRDQSFADEVMAGADVVLMLAAVVGGIQYNMTHHASIFRDNIRVFLSAMEACRTADVGRILVTSSACVYPRHCQIPTPETDGFIGRPEQTNEGYGWAKRMEEYVGGAYATEYGMSVAVARPYNAYGPRDDFKPASSHVIPALTVKALDSSTDTLLVWGSGKQSRSFLFATDFADGLIRICERATDAEPTNVGADIETTIGEIATLLVELSGTGKRLVFDTTKPEGQPRRHCDTTRLAERYDFKSRVSLRDGLAANIAYARQLSADEMC